MMDSQHFWEDSLQGNVKCENGSEEEAVFGICETSLNFSSSPGADSIRRGKTQRQDPMSHRIIEKRRRDRMNNCLADLSRLIPPDYLKKGRGRIEKTEIIEMAIRHLKYLQERVNCSEQRDNNPISPNNFQLGYQECVSEVMRYLVESQGHFPSENVCVHLINHLQRHCEQVLKDDVSSKPRSHPESGSSCGSSSAYLMNGQQLRSEQTCTAKPADPKERLRQHCDIYSCGDRKTFDTVADMKHARSGSSPEDAVIEIGDLYSQQSGARSFVGQKSSEGDADEGGSTAFARKALLEIEESAEGERRPNVDLCTSDAYPRLSPSYRHPLQRLQAEAELRRIRKSESLQPGDSGLSVTSAATDVDNIHSYKFKNTIKQRFSQSQSQSTDYRSSSPSDGAQNTNCFSATDHVPARREHFHLNGKMSHKRRKTNSGYGQYKDQMSSSETNSSENISSVSQNCGYRLNKLQQTDVKNNSTANDKDHIKIVQSMINAKKNVKLCDRPGTFGSENYSSKMSGVGVPIFALHAKGSFYVPMNVDYDSLIPFLGPYDLLDASSLQPNISLHPVTISVNFQPMFFGNKSQMPSVQTKSEHKDWQ